MSNLTKRVIAGIAGIPIILFACYSGRLYYLIFSLVVTTLALYEFYNLFEKIQFKVLKFTGIIFSVVILISNYFLGLDPVLSVYFAFLVFAISELIRNTGRNPLNPVIGIFGLIYITIPFILFGELNKYSGMNLMIFGFILIWICDTAAYFGGKFFGKHKLSEISPGKTIEGSITGFVFTVIFSAAAYFLYPEDLSLKEALFIGIITGTISQAGDLFESLLKRYCSVKDSSDLIPGHGGILDRFDSLLFVSPAVYIYIKYFN